MKKKSLFLSALLMSANLFAGTAESGQGPDGELFLDPYLNSELKNVSGYVVLDAGCGSAPWAAVAAENGAVVCGVASQFSLLDKAQIAVARSGVERSVELCRTENVNLPYEAAKFDWALSVGVGSDQPPATGLNRYFQEVARVLKTEGQLFIAAPASYDVVFTDGKHTAKSVQKHIQMVLAKIGSNDDPEMIAHSLEELDEVQRATFVRRGNQLKLVTDGKELKIGEAIWRKTPTGAISNYFHSEEEYLVAIRNAGLHCEEIKRPCFFGKVKYKAYRAENDELGEAYIDNNPFTLYYVTKRA
ncbi:MAG: hypothetical protein S4CHLAM2_01670 [Chlamydiales bacterium]|nr:hypothetical protein [Chlamydiales bacterium]